MNSDVHTLSLTKQDTSILRSLLRKELPAEIHLIVTSRLPLKEKTEKLETLYYDFHVLEAMLAWSEKDDAVGKALRQLNTEGVIRLRELVMGSVPEGQEPELAVMGVLRVVNKALSSPLDSSRLAFPIGDIEKPEVRA